MINLVDVCKIDLSTTYPLQLMTIDCGFRNHSILLICSKECLKLYCRGSLYELLTHVCLSYLCIYKAPLCHLSFRDFAWTWCRHFSTRNKAVFKGNDFQQYHFVFRLCENKLPFKYHLIWDNMNVLKSGAAMAAPAAPPMTALTKKLLFRC